MTAVHIALGVGVIVVNLAAGAWGAWRWWRVEPAPGFWPALRVGQALVAVTALQGGILVLMGEEMPELHLVYGLVPLGVSFLAEQLRLVAAETIMGQRGLAGRADVEALPPDRQRSLVEAILRREMGVMAASALVVGALGIRAAGLL